MRVRTRFAPSPTGFLHVGGLRTALYNYIFAKKNNGEFILRIEDTDQKRLVKDAISKISNSLYNFDIIFDEGPSVNEKYGPYKQSDRLNIYKKYYTQLISNDSAYLCYVDENQNLIPEKNSLYETVLVSANDELVNLYLKNKISFINFQKKLKNFMNLNEFVKLKKKKPRNIKEIHALNGYVRLKIRELCI